MDVIGKSRLPLWADILLLLLPGPVMMLAALGLLVFEPQDSADAIIKRRELDANLVHGNSVRINPEMEGKPVLLHGTVHTADTLEDTDYGVSAQTLQLCRHVQYYTPDGWVCADEQPKDAPEPCITETEVVITSQNCMFDAYRLDTDLLLQEEDTGGDDTDEVDATADDEADTDEADEAGEDYVYVLSDRKQVELAGYTIPQGLRDRAVVKDNSLYIGQPGSQPDPDNPRPGDVSLSWTLACDLDRYSIGMFQGDSLVPYEYHDSEGDFFGLKPYWPSRPDGWEAWKDVWFCRIAGTLCLMEILCWCLQVAARSRRVAARLPRVHLRALSFFISCGLCALGILFVRPSPEATETDRWLYAALVATLGYMVMEYYRAQARRREQLQESIDRIKDEDPIDTP